MAKKREIPTQDEFIVEKIHPSGGLLITVLYKGTFVRHRYFGYSVKQAKSEFSEYLRSLD